MRKLNKQDFIFIGKLVLYIAITFMLYLPLKRYFITDNCHQTIGGLGYAGYTCFGYLYFFDKVSIYFYTLFLWTTIVPYMRRKYLFPYNIVFIIGILVLMGVIIYIYKTTPIISLDDIPLRIGH